MKTNRHILTTGIALLLAPFAHGQAISIDSAGTCTQTFDTLPTVAGTDWANNSTIPGWYAQTQSTPIPINICDGGGAQPAGLQSIGLAASTERAPGFRLRSANGLGMTRLGLAFQNNTASPLSFGAFSYLGEMWCGHGTANTPDGFQFFYQIGGAAITDLGPFTVNNSGTFAAKPFLRIGAFPDLQLK